MEIILFFPIYFLVSLVLNSIPNNHQYIICKSCVLLGGQASQADGSKNEIKINVVGDMRAKKEGKNGK